VKNLQFPAGEMRKTVLKMAFSGSTVHIGCAFSIIELLCVLHRSYLSYPNNDPNAYERDYLLLSKGHGVMAQYAVMHHRGWLNDEDISNYFSDGSTLKGLSDSRIPGLEITSGSLGHGVPIGVGISHALKRRGLNQKVYILTGDGELNEGTNWEGFMFAAHHRLDNLMVIVDQNSFQAMGSTADILDLGNIKNKFESFGFDSVSVDGHNENEISQAIHNLWSLSSRRPKALIASTIKGKGVPFMEADNTWHYRRLDEETLGSAMSYL